MIWCNPLALPQAWISALCPSVRRAALEGETGEKAVLGYRCSYLLPACLFPQVWMVQCLRPSPRSRWSCPAVGK